MPDENKVYFVKKDGMDRLLTELIRYAPPLSDHPIKPQWDMLTDALKTNVRMRLQAPSVDQEPPVGEMYGLTLRVFKNNSSEISLPLGQDIVLKAQGYGAPSGHQLKKMRHYSYAARSYSLSGHGQKVDVRQLVRFENGKDATHKVMSGVDAYMIQIKEAGQMPSDKLTMFLRTCPSSLDQPYATCSSNALKSLMLFNILKN